MPLNSAARSCLFFLAIAAVVAAAAAASAASDAATVTVDLPGSGAGQPFPHYWEHCVGSGHLALGTRADWREHLHRAVKELGFQAIRAHGVFDDDMSIILNGEYQFYNVNQVYDYLLSINVRPLVELSFMPMALAKCTPDTCQWAFSVDDPTKQTYMIGPGGYKGLTMPPADFNDWYLLVRALAQHLVDRYGLAEVATWNFECWNELWGMDYPGNYFKLYNASAAALKSVHPSLRVGGPATMQVQYVGDFIARAKAAGLPVDFVSTHFYPSDPQCTPLVDNDCFAKTVLGAQAEAAKANLPFYLTEFNDGLEGGTFRDQSYAAAFVLHNIPLMRALDMFSWWTFTDIFEEGGLSARPFSNQFGLQTIYGVAKPVYRAFQMLHEAGNLLLNTTVAAGADGSAAYVRAFAVASALPSAPHQPALAALDVFVTNFQRINDTLPIPTPAAGGGDLVRLTLLLRDSDPVPISAALTLLDSTHSNPRALWEQWGAPMYPTRDQIAAMRERSERDPQPVALEVTTDAATGRRAVTLSFVLERNAAASIRVRKDDLQKTDTLVWAAVAACSVVLLVSALYCWRKNAAASASGAASKYAELEGAEQGFPRASYEAVNSVNRK